MARKVESTTWDSHSVRCVSRVLDILEHLQEHPEGSTLGDIVEAVHVPKSTVFRYLGTLQSRGFIERDPVTQTYRIGFGFALQMPFQVLAARMRPSLEQIRSRFDETASLGILDGGRVLYVSILESRRTMRLAAREGDHDPLHSTALGKVIAAQLPNEEIRRILDAEGMPRLTAATTCDAETYLDEIRLVRERGWAIDEGENELGGCCVAAPVRALRIPAGISLSAPSVRLPTDRIPEIAKAVVSAAAQAHVTAAPSLTG